jgi:hypothetical protein
LHDYLGQCGDNQAYDRINKSIFGGGYSGGITAAGDIAEAGENYQKHGYYAHHDRKDIDSIPKYVLKIRLGVLSNRHTGALAGSATQSFLGSLRIIAVLG